MRQTEQSVVEFILETLLRRLQLLKSSSATKAEIQKAQQAIDLVMTLRDKTNQASMAMKAVDHFLATSKEKNYVVLGGENSDKQVTSR